MQYTTHMEVMLISDTRNDDSGYDDTLCYTPSSFSTLTDMAYMADLTIMQFNLYGIPVLYTKFFL